MGGQYPPPVQKMFNRWHKKDFKQLEDFNAERDEQDDQYHDEYMAAMSGKRTPTSRKRNRNRKNDKIAEARKEKRAASGADDDLVVEDEDEEEEERRRGLRDGLRWEGRGRVRLAEHCGHDTALESHQQERRRIAP